MKQLRIFAIVMAAIFMASCNKDDQATGIGDALIISKLSGTNTVYGISLYAYSYSEFKSVSAVNNVLADHTYTLKANQGYKTNFYFETPDAEFTTTKPAASTFTFSAIFENGVTQDFKDILSDKVLPIPTVEMCEYNDTDHQLEVKWALLTNAGSYNINILDGSKVVFGSVEILNTEKTASIKATGGGWINNFTPESGKPYTVRLFANLFEPEGGGYDLQAISYAERTVTWGN